jgi:Flp pilus assembly CpaE family ATPase
MHLAREKVEFLRGFGLGKRVALVVNRYPKHHPLTPEQISDIVDVPVVATLPNDYRGVTSALSKGTFVDSKSELGRSYTALANSILENPVGDEEPKKKFLEFFSVMPKSLVPVKR